MLMLLFLFFRTFLWTIRFIWSFSAFNHAILCNADVVFKVAEFRHGFLSKLFEGLQATIILTHIHLRQLQRRQLRDVPFINKLILFINPCQVCLLRDSRLHSSLFDLNISENRLVHLRLLKLTAIYFFHEGFIFGFLSLWNEVSCFLGLDFENLWRFDR